MNGDEPTRPPEGDDRTRSASRDTHPSKRPATQLGPYRLLEKIGEGGFREVFAAEQRNDAAATIETDKSVAGDGAE